ncbi:MAG: 1-deoxy-D-xylulose-5-phosphate reductoisomerase, partial [Candidatus Omnitrophica bacterium]|nr:1-deoxy-D-xylulose-5-phosphate reductoisomerase [Candidatus Omnitrophota bacterium]
MKRIAVLGSSGSIGQSTLSVVRSLPKQFKVVALSVNSDIENLYKQVKEFQPPCVCIRDKKAAFDFTKKVKGKVKIFVEEEGLCEFVKDRRIERIMFAISGSAAFEPLISAIEAGKDIALANKEALVMAGPIIMRIARKH